MAGFQVSISGRFWVSTEGQMDLLAKGLKLAELDGCADVIDAAIAELKKLRP